MKLKATTVENLQATSKRQEIPDDLCTGLYLVIQPTGKKSWQVRYRHGGVHRRMTLASFPVLSLADARTRAREVMAQASEGRDPAEEVKAAKAPPPPVERDTVEALMGQYAKRHLKTLKSGDVVKRELDRFVVKAWGDRDIQSITKRDVLDLLDGIADSGRVVTANRIRAYLNKFLSWCIERDILTVSPAMGVKPVSKEKSRDRVLTDDEIRWLWQACDVEGFPWGPVAKTLLLTGQRLGEVVGMTDGEIRDNVWHLASARTKNGRAHSVYLSKPVRAVLSDVERIKGDAGLIFTTTGETPVSGFHKGRARLADRMAAIAADERGEPVVIPHWTFHDLRRTCATGMAKAGVPVRVTEAVLNHVSGTGGGIVGVYQVHDYEAERKSALKGWAKRVLGLSSGQF
jgi:integrase